LRDLHGADLLHAALARLLLLEELALARHVAAVEFRGHVLAVRLHRAAGDDLAADRRLHGHLELLPWNHLAQCLDERAPLALRAVAMNDHRHRVDPLLVDQDVELDERRGIETQELIIERRIAAAHRLQPIEEIENDLRERQLELERDLAAQVLELPLRAALLDAKLHHRAEIVLRHENARENDRLANLLDLRRRRELRRVLDLLDLALGRLDLVDHSGRGRDQREPVLALEALLHDLHVQQPEKAAAETEAE